MQGEPDPTDLEALKRAREEAERKEQKRREQEIDDFKWLMKDERGRRFVWRLMREARVFHNPSGTSDPYEVGRQIGQRDQGLKLVNEVLEQCPEQWIAMINDQKRT